MRDAFLISDDQSFTLYSIVSVAPEFSIESEEPRRASRCDGEECIEIECANQVAEYYSEEDEIKIRKAGVNVCEASFYALRYDCPQAVVELLRRLAGTFRICIDNELDFFASAEEIVERSDASPAWDWSREGMHS